MENLNSVALTPKQLFKVIEFYLNTSGKQTMMIWGGPGVGKSSIVYQVAEIRGCDFTDLRLTLLNPVDLRGIPYPMDGVTRWFPPEFLPKENGNKNGHILFIDEINLAPPSVQSAAYQLIFDKRIGEYVLPKNCRIIAAGNKVTDKGATYHMASPLSNRMVHFELIVNFDDWKDWAYEAKIHQRVIAFLNWQKGTMLFDFKPEITAFPSPRTWHFASNFLKQARKQDFNPDFLQTLIASCVGDAAAFEFMKFFEYYGRLPDVDAILAGKKVELPALTDPGAAGIYCALVAALIASLKESTLKTFCDFVINSLPREFATLAIQDSLRTSYKLQVQLILAKSKFFRELHLEQ